MAPSARPRGRAPRPTRWARAAVADAQQRLREPLGRVLHGQEVVRAPAQEPARHGVVGIARNSHDAPVLDGRDDRARVGAVAVTRRLPCFHDRTSRRHAANASTKRAPSLGASGTWRARHKLRRFARVARRAPSRPKRNARRTVYANVTRDLERLVHTDSTTDVHDARSAMPYRPHRVHRVHGADARAAADRRRPRHRPAARLGPARRLEAVGALRRGRRLLRGVRARLGARLDRRRRRVRQRRRGRADRGAHPTVPAPQPRAAASRPAACSRGSTTRSSPRGSPIASSRPSPYASTCSRAPSRSPARGTSGRSCAAPRGACSSSTAPPASRSA